MRTFSVAFDKPRIISAKHVEFAVEKSNIHTCKFYIKLCKSTIRNTTTMGNVEVMFDSFNVQSNMYLRNNVFKE